MSRKGMVVLGVTLGVSLVLLVAPALAALPGGGWWTSFQIQNVSNDTATLAYTAYWQVGEGDDETYSQSGEVTMPGGSALIYNPGIADPSLEDGQLSFDTSDEHLPAGFAGGVEVSADKPIAAVVQVGNNPAGTVGIEGGRASAFYQGTGGESVGSAINFPSMKHDYWGQTTSFYIQAAGQAANIDAMFRTTKCQPGYESEAGKEFPVTGIDVPQNRTYLLDPAAANVPEKCLGSLVVNANSGQIAGAVIETQHSTSPGTFALATRGFAPTDADTTIVAPTNKVGFWGGKTGWQILNTSDSIAASVAVTFTVTNVQPNSPADDAGIEIGDQYRADVEIGTQDAYLFSDPNGNYTASTPLNGAPALTDGVFFAGVAKSDGPGLVGVVNENNGPNRLVYSAFGISSATRKVAAPLVKEYFWGGLTGLAVQNTSTSAPATVNLSYDCKVTGETERQNYDFGPYEIDPNAAMSFIRLSDADRWGEILVDKGASCAVTISSDVPVVALAQESHPNWDTKNYEAFNVSLAP